MAISTEITRIQDDRNRIRTKLVELGIGQKSDTLDDITLEIEGITNAGAVSLELDGMTTDSVSLPEGFISGGAVTLSDTIEKALKAI